jgi:hypothetical protein
MSFTQNGDKTSPRAVCILCNEVMQNISMAPSKLKRHFETKHSEHNGKHVSFFPTYVEPIINESIYSYKIQI